MLPSATMATRSSTQNFTPRSAGGATDVGAGVPPPSSPPQDAAASAIKTTGDRTHSVSGGLAADSSPAWLGAAWIPPASYAGNQL
jgi:hypothetical protein